MMSKQLPLTSEIAKLVREITQEAYDAGYSAGWFDRAGAEQRVQTGGNRRRLAERDLKFAIMQLHPDRFDDDELIAMRANRVTAWLLDELEAARS